MASAPIVLTDLGRPALFKGRRPSVAQFVWLAFILVQVLDGTMSYVGVALHGPDIEGNPLVAWYLGAFGPAVGFTVAKLFAITCGAVLYLTDRYRWVAILTVVYVVFAVVPWVGLLAGTV